MNPADNMLRVDAIFYLPHMGVNYDSSFSDLRKFEKTIADKKVSTVFISFRNVDKLNHAYLFGLMENITANKEIQWLVKPHPEGEFTRALLTLDNVSAVDDGLSLYVQQEPVRIVKNK